MLRRITRKIRDKLGKSEIPDHQTTVTLHPEGRPRGNILLSYIINPFIRAEGKPISNEHTHHWESFQIAQTFLNHGFSVDVISYMNSSFLARKHYDYFISARTNLERIARSLNKDCIIVAHLDTAHWVSNNLSAYSRLLSLIDRRRMTITNSVRLIEPNMAIEHAHLATILGNEYTIGTYSYANKPIYRIPISTTAAYEWNSDKDYHRCRKNYLWFGSSGFVHKGLDLVLEAFSQMPDYHLTVCGPLENEKPFVSAYHNELFQTPNIHVAGWVDVNSERFLEITANCMGLAYPSCAEGGGGSAITCMHAGIVPILSREASVDIDDDCGVLLRSSSVPEIMESVVNLSKLPGERLQQLAKNAWLRAREAHSRERFAAEYDHFVSKILIPQSFGLTSRDVNRPS